MELADIHVVAGVIYNENKEILLAKRKPNAHQGGLWEFPGGKVEPGESAITALGRELHEECGIDVTSVSPLITLHHRYPDKSIKLEVLTVNRYLNIPIGAEGQEISWVEKPKLRQFPMPKANLAIVTALTLGQYYAITGAFDNETDLITRLECAITRGATTLQLRAGQLDNQALLAAAKAIHPICQKMHIPLIINQHLGLVEEIGLEGVHLSASQLMALKERPLGVGHWVGGSCHNRQEIEKAQQLSLDYISLSPINPTSSHPGQPALGLSELAKMTQHINIPVYALGGMEPALLTQAQQAGASGIAAISAFWHR